MNPEKVISFHKTNNLQHNSYQHWLQ